MNLKRKIIAIAIAAGAAPAIAFAGSANTINFQGEVTAQTCSVAVNGNTANPTVLLPTVSTMDLANLGDTAGITNFTIGVSGCTAPTASAQPIKTVFFGNQVDDNGNLGDTGTAMNVALQLLDPATSTVFNLGLSPTGYAADGLSLPSGATSASHDFAVRYYANSTEVAPGSVLGSVQYAVSYQ